MGTMKIKQLKETYEFACNEYVQKFCNKQELTNEGWVNDDVGGIALCSDFYESNLKESQRVLTVGVCQR